MRLFDDSIEALVVSEIKNGHNTAVQILGVLQLKKKKVTKQALYQALRKLKKEEVIVIFKKKISLSQIWLDRAMVFFESANHLNGDKIHEPFLNLTEGDSIAYSFKTPYLTDQFWAHAFLLLVATTSNSEPVYIYNPHEWFMVTRLDSEIALIKQLESYKRPGFFRIGNTDQIDRYVAKYFIGENTQYHASEALFAENYYINIFGDFILEVWLDKKITAEIDNWYKNTNEVTLENQKGLMDIVHKQGRNKMRISRNKKRSDRLKKFFAKDFYIPKFKVKKEPVGKS